MRNVVNCKLYTGAFTLRTEPHCATDEGSRPTRRKCNVNGRDLGSSERRLVASGRFRRRHRVKRTHAGCSYKNCFDLCVIMPRTWLCAPPYAVRFFPLISTSLMRMLYAQFDKQCECTLSVMPCLI
jgi:hypothetical protein